MLTIDSSIDNFNNDVMIQHIRNKRLLGNDIMYDRGHQMKSRKGAESRGEDEFACNV